MNSNASSSLTTLPLFPDSPEGIVHGYSTRGGGVSLEPWRSFNLGDHVGDDPARVTANRARFSDALGIPPDRWVTAEQVHGNAVAVVTEADAGRKLSGVDALVTDARETPLVLFFADCASVALVDTRTHAIGLAHAGWRGTAAEIALKTVRAMADTFGTRPGEVRAALGPCIGPCCYEVGPEVAVALKRWDGAIHRISGRAFADLVAVNRAQLLQAGVSPDRIAVSGLCTACQSDWFFSYRRDGLTGRMAALLLRREGG